MKRAALTLVVGAVVAATTLISLGAGASSSISTSPVARVWTEPQAGYGFLDAAIEGAHRSIDVSMYELSDTTMEHDLIAKARQGLLVRVLLNSAYDGRYENDASASLLSAGSVHVAWAPSGTIFHAKYVVIDDKAAYIGTGNFVSSDYASTRDFWLEDVKSSDVAAIVSTFAADFAHQDVAPRPSGGLVWSPGSTGALLSLIASAHTTLLVENEEMDSAAVEQALSADARRGVVVKVVMTYSSEWSSALKGLERAGVHVSTLGPSQLYIHAKVICADCTSSGGMVFIGSENFSTSSLTYNRELGVVTTSPIAVRAVEIAVNADYATGTVTS
ncbi:MAG: phospholipase D-like domain-containing protein [Acidimicrobiales bacterium]